MWKEREALRKKQTERTIKALNLCMMCVCGNTNIRKSIFPFSFALDRLFVAVAEIFVA